MNNLSLEHRGYNLGHPWYYLLGGKVLKPKQILAHVKHGGYQGYAKDDIAAADAKPEPRRSSALRSYRDRFADDLRRDLSVYRTKVRELNRYRETQNFDVIPTSCDDIHTAMSLKTAHLINDFAHLIFLDDLLSKQGDLFDQF